MTPLKEIMERDNQSPTTIFDIQKESCRINEKNDSIISNDDIPTISNDTPTDTVNIPCNASATTKQSIIGSILKSTSILTLIVLYLSYLFTTSCLYYRQTYISPLINKTGQTYVHEEMDYEYNNMNNGLTYFLRECDADDITTISQDTITFQPHHTQPDFVDTIMRHGAGIYPSLLPSTTISKLREVILKMNYATSFDKMFSLKEHGNRWSLRLNPYDRRLDEEGVIQQALREVSENEVVRGTLEDILGDDPAMVELAAITSTPGALVQDWHCDTWYDASHLGHARSYGAVYSMFIYLQDTYVDMGVTGMCLGTHTCSGLYDVNDCIFPTFKAGTAAILNSQLYHQGSGNTAFQREDGTRVMFIITFASRPKNDDPRVLALGSVYGIPWYVWGHTLDDYKHMSKNNWMTSALQSLGVNKIGKNDGISVLMGTAMARAENYNAGIEDEW